MLLPLRLKRSDNYCNNYRERNNENKERNYTKNKEKKIKSNKFTMSNREKIKSYFAFWFTFFVG